MSQFKRLIVGTVLILIVTALAALNINQTWRYRQLEDALITLEQQQNLLYEENKRLLGAITELESPERLLSLIAEHPEWNLHKLGADDIILIKTEEQ